eukprot:141031_1
MSLDVLSQEQLFLKTLTSFSTKLDIATRFASGMILVINNVYQALVCGDLKAADVSWISCYSEWEYIVLPTTFNNFKQLSYEEVWKRQWIVMKSIKVYET